MKDTDNNDTTLDLIELYRARHNAGAVVHLLRRSGLEPGSIHFCNDGSGAEVHIVTIEHASRFALVFDDGDGACHLFLTNGDVDDDEFLQQRLGHANVRTTELMKSRLDHAKQAMLSAQSQYERARTVLHTICRLADACGVEL